MPLNRKPPVTITVPNVPRTSYELSNSGTFTEGDLTISRQGLQIAGTPTGAAAGERAGASRDAAATTPTSTRATTPRKPSTNARDAADAAAADDDAADDAADADAAPDDRRHETSGETPSKPGAPPSGDVVVSLDELVVHGVVGKGSGGVVQRATHARTGAELAVKVVQMNVQAEVRKNLIAELRTLHQSAHPHVVPYHGAFFSDGSVSILLDYMNVGSLSDVAKVLGKIPERELASVSRCVLRGLAYLHGDMRVIHRDVKPSNVLVNDAGEVKISDFGVSGQLANSVTKCNSWVGTVTYMSPERISGGTYGFDSDVWSFALSIVECALGRFPYPPPADEEAPSGASGGEGDGADAAHKPRQPMGFWDLLDHIVEEPPPTLPRGGGHDFSDAFRDAIASCLKKSPKERVSASELLKHEWFEAHPEEGCDLAAFFADVGERRAKEKEEKACKTQKRR